MSDPFGKHELDLIDLIKSVKTHIADKIPIAENEEKKILIRRANKDLDTIALLLGEMEFETNKFGPNAKMSMQNKLRAYRVDIDIMQKDLKKLTSESTRLKNYDNMGYDNFNELDPERRKMMQIHGSLKNTSQSLARSNQIAIETENIGNEVLNELNDQGQQLQRANEQLDETNMGLSKSRRIMNSISRGVVYNKCLMILIVVLELFAIAGLVFWKFFT